jgi:hypothetical protein
MKNIIPTDERTQNVWIASGSIADKHLYGIDRMTVRPSIPDTLVIWSYSAPVIRMAEIPRVCHTIIPYHV